MNDHGDTRALTSKQAARQPIRSAMRGLVWLAVVVALGWGGYEVWRRHGASERPAAPPAARGPDAPFKLTPSQLASLTIAPVEMRRFRQEWVTEGKIAIDEDRATPIYSPFGGRVRRIAAKPGDLVAAGDPLFSIEVGDLVQAQNDLMAARSALNKARSQVRLAEASERRLRDLFAAKAAAQRDWQQAQNDLTAARNDARAAEVALEAARNRLRILGKSDADIDRFADSGAISPETIIASPIRGTVVSRKIGPGQYIAAGASDPAFTVGDMTRVWLVASVREIDAQHVKVGQDVRFRVLAAPGRVFSCAVSHIGAAVDAATRRVPVRCVVDNADGLLKPEMFAHVTLLGDEDAATASAPAGALIYQGDQAHLWTINTDGALVLKRVRTGLTKDDRVQILDGLSADDRIVVKGGLFLDRAASGDAS